MSDDFDFLSKLNNMYNGFADNDSDDKDDIDNQCLITRERLEDTHIILKCGHKYNYMPLFNYIIKDTNKNFTCPYCSQGILNTLPIRKINGKYIYNKKINLPLENCITDEHKCYTCGSPRGFNGTCIRHHKYIVDLFEMMTEENSQVIENKIKKIEKELDNLFKKCWSIIYDILLYDNLFDDIILDNLEISLLKLLSKKYNLCVNLSKINKYELISYIKIVSQT